MASLQSFVSARQVGMMSCPDCGLVSHLSPTCPRCGAVTHVRKLRSLQRGWALWIAAVILYVPANFYPIMTTEWLGQATPSTIISGVWMLLEHHSYLVATVVFVASILIPILKFFAVAYLLWIMQRPYVAHPESRLRLYRLVELVGRWSMIDIFVVAILAALVQFSGLARILPGPGADAFAAVVVLTMLAAHALDPRLIWDRALGYSEKERQDMSTEALIHEPPQNTNPT